MRIVVVGAGQVGAYLSQILSDRGHDVTVVEESESTAQAIDEEYNVRVIPGNGSSAQTLVNAKAGNCDYLLAMTSDDRSNIIACSIGKKLGAETSLARIHDQTYTDNSYVNYQLHFSLDHLLNPEALTAVELAKKIRNPGRVAVENFARGEIEVQQIRVSGKSRLTGTPLKDLRLEKSIRLAYIQRGDEYFVPSAQTTLQDGDLITVVGPPQAVFETKPKIDPTTALEVQRVTLFGGSETAIALIRLLKHPRFKIRVIESERELCRGLAERFPDVTVVQGSATSLRLMEEEQVGSADYFVACTKDDEDNIMTCLQASKLGCKHVQLVINKPDYEEVLDQLRATLGVELVVSPRIVTVNEVLRLLSREAYIGLASLPGGQFHVIEIPVPVKSPIAGKQIREVSWPKDSIVVALLHKFQARVPRAEDTVLAGDRLVVVIREGQIKEIVRHVRG